MHLPRLLLTLLACLAVPAALAMQVFQFDAEAERERFNDLTAELRCLVCQNQSLADSNADLAQDLREQVYERIRAGQTNQQIIDFMVQRYGEFVLYRPPVQRRTWLLWFGPFLLLALGVAAVVTIMRRRAGTQPAPALSDAERAQARALLDPGHDPAQRDR